MMPISKVFGGDNCGLVDQSYRNRFRATMGIQLAEGISEAAAKLHSIDVKDEWQY